MITEIIIEGARLDLFDDIGAELNYSIDDVKDFGSRNTSYSKTITLPGNANNNKIFGHIYNLASANNYYISNPDLPNVGYNFDPTKQAEAKILVNKIQVFKGVLRLLEIKINDGAIEYECVVFGELGGFVSSLGSKLIENITNFSAYNQAWTAANIVASWDNVGTGIVYPLIDYGLCKHGGSSKDYHIDAFRPAFHLYELMDSIITESGYTYNSDFFNTSYFKSLIIPNNKAVLEQLRKDLLEVYNSKPVTATATNIQFDTIANLTLFSNFNDEIFTFTHTLATLGKFRVLGQFVYTSAGTFTVAIYQNATIIYDETFNPTIAGQVYSVDWLIDATLNLNDQIRILVTYSGSGISGQVEPNINFSFVADYAQPAKATIDATLDMTNLLPKGIEQKDFFTSVCRLFNLYVFEDANKSNHLIIEPYIEFYLSGSGFLEVNSLDELLLHGEAGDATGLLLLPKTTAETVDWSSKVDHSKEVTIKPMSELNARYFEFKYKEDDDFYNDKYQSKYNQTYADRKEDSKFEFADEVQSVEVIFSPSVLVPRLNDTKLCVSIFSLEDGNEVPKDHNIRIMNFKKITGVSDYHIKAVYPSNNNTSVQLNSYGYAGHLNHPTAPTNDLNFAIPNEVYFRLSIPYPTANLFTTFWGDYIAEITAKDSKLLTCYLYLTIEDIYNLNFSRLIYLDGALFRLNKVFDFNPILNETTKVELLRVIELTYD